MTLDTKNYLTLNIYNFRITIVTVFLVEFLNELVWCFHCIFLRPLIIYWIKIGFPCWTANTLMEELTIDEF